ncbi:SGNH/GDSL hydrolase family protein [uncultured Roseobacter sp.]|uniref:SGNH/GDSL hydrolase family protein n=1 Tax=uncultured Roseobacter sp. TaxID=114847 RepID=UPI002636E37F|nr:SGNH/GDSL hydrolase family protein [uncultured Roseobacter sp.]
MRINGKAYRRVWAAALMAAMLVTTGERTVRAEGFSSPDVLILGDSQISFGAGHAFLEFFSDIMASCAPDRREKKALSKLGAMQVGVIGVRSTSIHSWVARGGAAKDAICEVDKKWKVNAGSYGVLNTTKNQFVQMGQGRNYQVCEPGQSAFEAMFAPGYYDPSLLILTFLGNSAKRWAENPDLAVRDVRALEQHLPADLPCVFMTTAPAHTKKVEKQRLAAQENIKRAFAETGSRCTFVEGSTPATIKANQSTRAFFRQHKDGRVKDPYHPNKRGARNTLKLEMDNICEAIFTALGPDRPPS